MSFIEGIGDDFLYAFGFLVFIAIVTLAWFSTHVNHLHFPTTLFIIERRTRRRDGNIVLSMQNNSLLHFIEEESERLSSTPPSRLTPPNEQSTLPDGTQIEHESDNEYDD